MIISEYVELKINSNKISYYKKKGYKIPDDLIIKVKISDLTKSSRVIVECKCDICNKKVLKQFKLYNQNTKQSTVPFACSQKCARKKAEHVNLKKYGVKNPFQQKKVKDKIKAKYGDNFGFGSEYFKKKSQETLQKKYGVSNIGQLKSNVKYYSQKIENLIDINNNFFKIKCNKCNKIYEISKDLYYHRIYRKSEPCLHCKPLHTVQNYGQEQFNIIDFIKHHHSDEIILNNRTILEGKEIDIYLPKLKLGFEYNGLYWHSSQFLSDNYHAQKTELCASKDIQLIHIWEDSWLHKNEIVKSRILNLLGKSKIIYARKCKIKEINSKEARLFLEKTHIQGYANAVIKLGLFYEEKLVSVMTFCKTRKALGYKNNNNWELLRFSNALNTSVVGGASRLFKYFLRTYYKSGEEIISYADKSWSKGNLYGKLKFKLSGQTKPDYWYIVDGIRENRFKYRKSNLIKMGFAENKTERSIMLERGIYRIYGPGSLKFSYSIK